jgi:hypothetical protein
MIELWPAESRPEGDFLRIIFYGFCTRELTGGLTARSTFR